MVMVAQTEWDYNAPPVGVVTVWDYNAPPVGQTTGWDEINNAAALVRYDIVRTRDKILASAKMPGPVRWPIGS